MYFISPRFIGLKTHTETPLNVTHTMQFSQNNREQHRGPLGWGPRLPPAMPIVVHGAFHRLLFPHDIVAYCSLRFAGSQGFLGGRAGGGLGWNAKNWKDRSIVVKKKKRKSAKAKRRRRDDRERTL